MHLLSKTKARYYPIKWPADKKIFNARILTKNVTVIQNFIKKIGASHDETNYFKISNNISINNEY